MSRIVLVRAILLVSLCVYFANAAPLDSSIKRLPVIDKHDIRFVPLVVGGETFKKRVLSMAQDNYGFVWLGTDDGLYRYDGYTLTPYRHSPENPGSLSDNVVMFLYEDRAGVLWVATGYGGLDRFDPARGVFKHYRHDPGDSRSLRDDHLTYIYQDRAGSLWIGTNDGPDRLDVASGRFFHYSPPSNASPRNNAVFAFYDDEPSNFLVGTVHGLYKLDRSSGRFSPVSSRSVASSILNREQIGWLMPDRTGALWATSPYARDIGVLNPKTGEVKSYTFSSESPGSRQSAGVMRVHEDRNGVLWIGTIRDGLLRFDQDRKKFIRYNLRPDGGPPDEIWALLEDSEGNIWVGGESGVSRFQAAPPPFVNYRHEPNNLNSLPNDKVLSVYTDARGFLWIGTAGGLQTLDRKSGEMVLYQHDSKNPTSLSSNEVSSIAEDGSGRLWIGTHGGGLNRFDRAAGRFSVYRHNPKDPQSLSSDLILYLFVEAGGVVWVGTEGGGLNRFEPSTGRFKSYRNDPKDPTSLSHDIVRTIFTDRAGTLWVGTNSGLDRFDRVTERFTRYVHNERDPASIRNDGITAIREDHQGALWIGTRGGLSRMDRSRATFTNFTTQDGLANDGIEAIREDNQGNLWLATHDGISEFWPQTKTVRNYSEADGLPGDYQDPTGTGERGSVTPEGELIFASDRAVTVFNPNRVSANPFVPPVVLTDFLLFSKPVPPSLNSPLQEPIWATRSLTLNHDQSIFTLEFAALSYIAPERNRYRYKLENLEKEWSEVGEERRAVTYTNVPPGKYVFRVQGSNDDLVWNETGARLDITVLPPWYGTWTFRTAAALLVVALIVAIVRLRVRNLKLTAARLERQVADRTVELKAAKESAESANRAKSVFLSHMSHELRTPLNAILGFSNLLREDGVSQKQRADLDVIHRSGEHLLGLIDDVLDVAKIEAGRATVEIAPCDLKRLVEDVTDMMRVRAAEKNLELRLVQSSEVARFVETDGPKLRQMLINLLGNAIKHTERGSVTLRVDAQNSSDPEHVLLSFEVQDTGIGIAPQDQERIFEPFVQAGNTLRQKGTGLGLAITRQFAIMVGGNIRVISAPGEGSVFGLEIPARLAEQFETDASATEREYVLSAGQPDYRVLVVDDSPENRDLLQRLLEKAGFPVRVAENGAEAVEMFQNWRPHFIWMDLRMPIMDGVEATRHIRGLNGGREVKIVAVTASENTNQPPAGMDDLIRKPYRPHEIFDCMARYLGVTYRSDEAAAAPLVESPAILRPEALATLPEGLRAELTNAVLTLDVNQIRAVVGRVSEVDPALAAALQFHADRFAFTAVLQALEDCKSAKL